MFPSRTVWRGGFEYAHLFPLALPVSHWALTLQLDEVMLEWRSVTHVGTPPPARSGRELRTPTPPTLCNRGVTAPLLHRVTAE